MIEWAIVHPARLLAALILFTCAASLVAALIPQRLLSLSVGPATG